jgi:hypothetical protein
LERQLKLELNLHEAVSLDRSQMIEKLNTSEAHRTGMSGQLLSPGNPIALGFSGQSGY